MYNSSNSSFDSSLTQKCIPYFYNIGFNSYKLQRPAYVKSRNVKNDDFMLIPKQKELIKFMNEQAIDMVNSGLMTFK